jgi:hypothetical protein
MRLTRIQHAAIRTTATEIFLVITWASDCLACGRMTVKMGGNIKHAGIPSYQGTDKLFDRKIVVVIAMPDHPRRIVAIGHATGVLIN